MTKEELIDKFGSCPGMSKSFYAELIDQDKMAKNDFFYFEQGYNLAQEAIKTQNINMGKLSTDHALKLERKNEIITQALEELCIDDCGIDLEKETKESLIEILVANDLKARAALVLCEVEDD